MGPKMGPKYYLFGIALAQWPWLLMSRIVAHFLAKMHPKTMQFHILDSFYDNMSFLMFEVGSLSQKLLKISSKNMDPNGSENIYTIPTESLRPRRREKRPA